MKVRKCDNNRGNCVASTFRGRRCLQQYCKSHIFTFEIKVISSLSHSQPSSKQPISVVLAEDQELIRKALVSLLKDEPHIRIAGEAGNGRELLDLLDRHQPDVVLLDIEMPVMDGKETLEAIRRRFPQVKVIMLSLHADMTLMSEFMSRGANAYIPKGSDVDTLVEAIEAVKYEGEYFGNGISKALQKALEKDKKPVFAEIDLTGQELAILKDLCNGMNSEEIGKSLGMPVHAIDFHTDTIYAKTNSRNITDLVKYAIRHRVIELDK